MAKALEKTYDAIIIGAGHHGLILGSYLAKAGLDVLLVERRLTYGGGLSTREVTQPGFYHNLHSINHFHISETPWFRDLGLDDKVTYITPPTDSARRTATEPLLVLGRELEDVANIARFSARDARHLPGVERSRGSHHGENSDRNVSPSRCNRRRGAFVAHRDGPRFSRRHTAPAARPGASCSRTNTCSFSCCSDFTVRRGSPTRCRRQSPHGSVIRAFDLQTGYQLCQGGSFNLARG